MNFAILRATLCLLIFVYSALVWKDDVSGLLSLGFIPLAVILLHKRIKELNK